MANKPQKRPLTQAEIKKKKELEKGSGEKITVYSRAKRTIPIQVREPGKDFYVAERTIHLGRGKKYTDYKSRFNMDQIDNLRKKGEIQVVNG